MTYRIGIDVGGTHTDAVILDERNSLYAKTKAATTEDVGGGIQEAIRVLLADSGIKPTEIASAMLGTTHCTNAIVERTRLSKIGVIRIGAPATDTIPPLSDWPMDLYETIYVGASIVRGGHEYNGQRLSPLDEQELCKIAEQWRGKVRAVAITSVFSPVDSTDERRAKELMAQVLGPDVSVSLSHEIGNIGLLERENATILNASLTEAAEQMVKGFRRSLAANGIENANIYLSQNDGTLMTADYAIKFPVLTIASGPTNSIRGASFLCGIEEALVVDVGGTTTDIGVLTKGFPRESSLVAQIGGVRTNFRMPDLLSFGLGGGTRIRGLGADLQIGPDSLGYRLKQEGLLFGGDVLTASDIAVAVGQAKIGDAEKLAHLPAEDVHAAYQQMIEMVEEAIDRMKTSSEPVPAILVGGGSVLLPDQLQGVSEVVRPEHFEVANAIGVTIAQVSGQIDRIYANEARTREEILEDCQNLAIGEAVRAGALPETVKIVEIEEIPLAYLSGNAVRMRAKAVGELFPATAGVQK